MSIQTLNQSEELEFRLKVCKDPEYSFGFKGFDNNLPKMDNSLPEQEYNMLLVESFCISDHGHCWELSHQLLCYPLINVYKCTHCGVDKEVQTKKPSVCRFEG